MQRNVHSSTIDGLVLSGLRPRFVAPELDPELGVAHCLTPESLDAGARRRARGGRRRSSSPRPTSAPSPTSPRSPRSPTRAGCPLVVDEAWGAHLSFSSALPDSALACGADVVLSSTHKIAGSITQSAILHVGECGDRIDDRIVDRSVTLVESTSPNALLTASLDATRRQAAVHGEELLGETVESLARLRERIRSIPGLDVLDERIVGRGGVHAYDPTRLVVDVRGLGTTGHRVARLMLDHDDINLELFAENVVVARVRDRRARRADRRAAGRGARARRRADRRGGARSRCRRSPSRRPGARPCSRRARPSSAARRSSRSSEAEGRIVAESLAAYPPGVPNVLPGEVLTRPTLDYIADSVAHGGLVRGASDRTLKPSEW